MPLVKTGPYPGDEVGALSGFDGTEPRDVLSWSRQHRREFAVRTVFSFGQYYPGFGGGSYFNKWLVAIFQEAIGRIGLSVVLEDVYRREGAVPVELPGSLERAEDYLLVDDGLAVRGRLRLWESLGGKGAFYHDQVLLEIVSGQPLAGEILETFRGACQARQIKFTETRGSDDG